MKKMNEIKRDGEFMKKNISSVSFYLSTLNLSNLKERNLN